MHHPDLQVGRPDFLVDLRCEALAVPPPPWVMPQSLTAAPVFYCGCPLGDIQHGG